MKFKSSPFDGLPLLLAMFCIVTAIFTSCKKESILATGDKIALEKKNSPYSPDYSKINNGDLRQVAYTIINTSKKGLGQDLITEIGTPIWNESLEKGNLQKQWIIPFSLDNQSVNAVMIIEKTDSKYKYLVISDRRYNGKVGELSNRKKLLLGYFNLNVFGKRTLNTITVDKSNKFPLTLIMPVTNTRNRWEQACITGNVFCNCPSWFSQCDMCEDCMGTYCYSYWVASPEDELEEFDPGGPGGSGGGGDPGYLFFLSTNLNLTESRVIFLSNFPGLQNELYNYLMTGNNLGDEEVKQICREHIDGMMNNSSYLQFVLDHSTTGAANTIWWKDDSWLNNPSNFNLDITRANNQYYGLTAAEKNLIVIFPFQAFIISQNIQQAHFMSDLVMGTSGGLNDKKDAFRHAYFNAINTRDVPMRLFPIPITGSAIVTLFANAHESEVPPQLQLEKQMDLFNNGVGISYCWNCFLTSNITIANAIFTKLNNGELKYIKPLNFSTSPYFDANGDGIQDCSTCLNGILNNSVLTPTNQ